MAITVLKPYVILRSISAELIGPHRFPRGAGFRLSRQQVEARLMEWALHAVALNPPFGQSRIAMRTVIRQREKFPVHPEDGDICPFRSEEHTSELQSLMRISYAVFCLKKKTK